MLTEQEYKRSIKMKRGFYRFGVMMLAASEDISKDIPGSSLADTADYVALIAEAAEG